MRRFLSLFVILMLGSFIGFAQSRVITGLVKDQAGEPVKFATVTEVGTKNIG